MAGFDYLKNFLKNEGFRSEESEGLLNFKIEGTTYFAFKNDSRFLQIFIPCKYECSKSKALEICNELNSDTYIAKNVVNGDRVWCCWEFEPTEQTTADDFMTIFHLLDKISDDFLEKANK